MSGWLVLATGCGRIGFDLPAAPGDARLDGTVETDGMQTSTADAAIDGRPVDLIPGLVLWYPLDDVSFATGAVDASGGNRTATCTSCPTPIAGKVGGAAAFDGTTQYLSRAYDAGLATPSGFTIAAFVYPDALTANTSVIAKPHGSTATANTYQIEILDTDEIRFKTRGNATGDQSVVGPNATAGAWQHVAGTWDGTTMQLYVNGVAAGSAALPDLVTDTAAILVGGDMNGGSPAEELDGRLDDVRLYNRALTPAEVMLLASQ